MVKNPPASAEDTGSIPAPGRFHMPWGSSVCAMQLRKSASLEPVLCHKRRHHIEKPMHSNEDPVQPKLVNWFFKKILKKSSSALIDWDLALVSTEYPFLFISMHIILMSDLLGSVTSYYTFKCSNISFFLFCQLVFTHCFHLSWSGHLPSYCNLLFYYAVSLIFLRIFW